MSQPSDQPQRQRFVSEIERNFSVVASAGSGKTRAITDRIIELARSPHALEWLPALVVVTFTNRAADEMQQRARQQILEAGISLEVLAAFNRAFFGTIHSFCVKLLRLHGHHLGLPGRLELLSDDDELWADFVQQQTTVGDSLTPAQRAMLVRFVPVRRLMALGRHGGAAAAAADEPGACCEPDFTQVLAFTPTGSMVGTVSRSQEAVREWEQALKSGAEFLPLPQCASTSQKFLPLWNAALEPLREWICCCSLKVSAQIENAYREFRLRKGVLTYNDQVALARDLLRHPDAARRIRENGWRVILDEAQDTDPAQFTMLLELARPPSASGAWLETRGDPPRPGHFCMAGDFQQSIYGDRADLAHYRRVHDTLLATGAGEALEFSVTFRLDQQQIDFVNETFAGILNDTGGQVPFVRLHPRPQVLPGQIVRFELDPGTDGDGLSDAERAWLEARQLARWLRAHGLEKLRAQTWRDVAILCPRKDWFRPLGAALRDELFDVQLQSERDLKGDSPAYAWLTALLVSMAEPRHSYEIVGVLREIFGLSDHDLAEFCEGFGDRFQIARETERHGPVAETLKLLAATRGRLRGLPLLDAVREIVCATQLRERLLALPAQEFEDLDAELDELLTLAARAEAEQQTLADFAETLRTNFSAVREVRATSRDAVQLITCQKAKGSEWQAVIVPFLSQRIYTASGRYPRLLQHPRTSKAIVAFGREYLDDEAKEALKLQQRQEMERLLYVALTRAKHTLVIAHDHALFAGKNGISETSQATYLQCVETGVNADAFLALGPALAHCAETAAHQHDEHRRRAREQRVEPLEPCVAEIEETARTSAAHFIKRNPSALAEAAAASDPAQQLELARPHRAPENAGTRYGNWWHAFAEQIDWRAGASAWDATFAAHQPRSPDATLSQREWELLRAQLANRSALARLLTRGELLAHAEMPFLWAMNDRECLEGVIDLAVFDPLTKSWLILDWKTNRVAAEATAKLRAHYAPQLAAYRRAVSEMLGAPVVAGIYSTATGEWLPYDARELDDVWHIASRDPALLTAALAEQ